jgi:dTDP-4-dehydrorhamnose 3,5-epimerase
MTLCIHTTGLPGLLCLSPQKFVDERGYFFETWNRRELSKAGIDVDFVQDNQSWSRQAGTLRGLHFQAPPHAQDKLIRCIRGKIFDVAVDIRRGSPAYGQWHGVELSPGNATQLFIPKGFLHGFLTLEADTEVQYKCSDYYTPECDGAVRWDSLGIDWPLAGAPVLSQKDVRAVPFSAFQSPFVWGQGT